jgi:hypothetical protein
MSKYMTSGTTADLKDNDGKEFDLNGMPCRIINQATFSGIPHWGFQSLTDGNLIGWVPKAIVAIKD